MTATEMKYEFEVRSDLVSNSQAPGLTDNEIDIFLNLGQDKLIEELFTSTGIELLNDLVTTLDVNITSSYTEISNAKTYNWTTSDTDLAFFVDAAIKVASRTNPTISSPTWIQCDKIDKVIAHNFASNTFNTPWFKQPKVFLEDEQIVIIYDAYTTISSDNPNLKFEYIRKPLRINQTGPVNCELKDFFHKDVVEKAVNIAMITYNIDTSEKTIKLNQSV